MTESAKTQIELLYEGRAAGNDGKKTSAREQGEEAVKDIVYGSVAGIIGKSIEYPFDTVKVRLQSQSATSPRYSGPLDCFRQSIKADGIPSLYRGISAPLVGAAIETSSLFFSYRVAQDAFRLALSVRDEGRPLPLPALVGCGAVSGAFTSLLLTPIELVKCQMQVPVSPGTAIRLGPLRILAIIYRHSGLLGLWHGQLGTLIRETGGSAMWFGSYESVCAVFRHYRKTTSASHKNDSLPVWQQMTAGATAGMTYNFICYPADTIKSRMQTADFSSTAVAGEKQTFWNVGKAVWRQQGIRGLYQGCGITVGRAIPASACIFAVYEGLRGWDRQYYAGTEADRTCALS